MHDRQGWCRRRCHPKAQPTQGTQSQSSGSITIHNLVLIYSSSNYSLYMLHHRKCLIVFDTSLNRRHTHNHLDRQELSFLSMLMSLLALLLLLLFHLLFFLSYIASTNIPYPSILHVLLIPILA